MCQVKEKNLKDRKNIFLYFHKNIQPLRLINTSDFIVRFYWMMRFGQGNHVQNVPVLFGIKKLFRNLLRW